MISDFGELKVDDSEGLTSPLLSKDEIIERSITVDQNKMTGVYFLINNDQVVYVGQSKDVITRVSVHMKNAMPFNRFFYINCPEGALDTLESVYIHFLCPPLNGKNRNGKSAPKSFEAILDLIHLKVPEDGSWNDHEMPAIEDDADITVVCMSEIAEICRASISEISEKSFSRRGDVKRWFSGNTSKGSTFHKIRSALVSVAEDRGFIEKGTPSMGPEALRDLIKSGAEKQNSQKEKTNDTA